MSKKDKVKKADFKKTHEPKSGSYLYIESIKDGPISALDRKSGMRIDLFKGLTKVKKSVWASCKGLPMIAAYLKAGTLKESKVRCLDPDQKSDVVEKPVVDEKVEESVEETPTEDVEEIPTEQVEESAE